MLSVSRFYHIHIAAGDELKVKNCTKIYLRLGSDPRTQLGELTALPQTP